MYLPGSAPGPEMAALSPAPSALAGARVAVLDNGKPNAGVVMVRVAETLATRTGAIVSLVTYKGPQSRSVNAAIPVAEDIFEQLVGEVDVVVTDTADCGSCTAYSVQDTIELEKAGVPAVVVTTTKFEPVVRTLAASFGLAEARTLVLPHPIGGTDEVTLHEWAVAHRATRARGGVHRRSPRGLVGRRGLTPGQTR